MRVSRPSLALVLPVTLVMVLSAHGGARAQKMPTLAPSEGRRVGDVAIDFKAQDLDGRPYRLKDLRGKVVQVVFWATWCVPCIEEVPRLRDVYAKYRDRGLEVLAVVVPTDQTKEGVRAFVAKNKMDYPILWDEGRTIMDRYRIDAIPQNVLVGRDGVIRYAGGGLPDGYDAVLESALAQAAAPRAAAR